MEEMTELEKKMFFAISGFHVGTVHEFVRSNAQINMWVIAAKNCAKVAEDEIENGKAK